MKKKIFLTAVCALALSSAFAQTSATGRNAEGGTSNYEVEENSFRNNWFVSVGAGAQMYVGDHDRQVSFGDRISPALDIAVGKWFTPVIGARLMYSGLSAKGATQDIISTPTHSTGEWVPGKDGWGNYLQYQKFNFFNIQADALFNVLNLFRGYDETHVYNCSPYVGIGVASVTDEPKKTSLSGHFGVLNSFRLCSALDLNVDLRGTLVGDGLDGEPGGRNGEGIFSATIGLTYKFKPRGW